MVEPEEHPVASGLGALVGVGLTVGLVLALMALVGTQVLGLGGGGGGDGSPAAEHTLYVPSPKKTPTPTGPLITLQPVDITPTPEVTQEPSSDALSSASASPSVGAGISLVAGQQSVAPMQRIDLSGTYLGGAGAVLQVQRFAGGGWTDFPVTVSVNGQAFTTYVETGQAGENRFRVLDPASGKTSNEVSVSVG